MLCKASHFTLFTSHLIYLKIHEHSCKILYIQIEKLMKYLKAEKACQTDLEMYVAVINVI